jgi:hypothetical protein
MQKLNLTHEQFIAAIAAIALEQLQCDVERDTVSSIKLTYGAGPNGVRGVTYYAAWQGKAKAMPFVEISAFNQESIVQVAGTVLHELGHVLAGWNAGHGPDWHKACDKLGLRKIRAAGTRYGWANFKPCVRNAITALGTPVDGTPKPLTQAFTGRTFKPRPCGAGIGTRGGKSRGFGSGSRLRLYECECAPKPFKVRIASDDFDATCNCCTSRFLKR